MAEILKQRDTVVSFDSEELILVDEQDREIGHRNKADCHDGHGILHRAFSLFVFDPEGRLLLQQRSKGKRLWPGYWANSCCSHPRAGESMEEATSRRLLEEMGMQCSLRYLYKFLYQADYGDLGAEHELCWVYVGQTDAPVKANRTEVEDWRFVDAAALDAEIEAHPERFTPWLKLEWRRLREEFHDALPASAKG